MGKRKFPVEAGSCHESADQTSKDRDDLIEAGRRLVRAKAQESSNLGVRSSRKAWTNRYPKGGKLKKGRS